MRFGIIGPTVEQESGIRWSRDVAAWITAGLSLAAAGLSFVVGATARYRPQFGDEIVYRLLAHNLLNHHYYGYSHYSSIAYRPPGYPVFDASIRAINDSSTSVRAVQALLAGSIIWLAAWIARRLFGSIASVVTALLLVAVGTVVTYSTFELSETLATATLLASIGLLIWALEKGSWKRGFAAGLVLGLSILTRPQVSFLIVPLVLIILVQSRGGDRPRRIVAALLIVGAIAAVTPWTIRNAVRLHAFVPVSTYGGEALFLANNPKADGLFHRTTIMSGLALYEKVSHLPEEDADRYWYHLAIQYIVHHPGKSLRNWVRDAYYYVKLPDDLTQKWYQVSRGKHLPALDDRFLWPFVVLGAFAVFRSKNKEKFLPLVIIAYFIVFFMVFIPSPRFRHGVIPFNAIVVSAGFAFFIEWARRRVRPEDPAIEPHRPGEAEHAGTIA
ncbi:MAG: ArnT family glycosyltransferase [Thermoanaerobaculia bacterium]